MDSGNSGSLQSSSGGDNDVEFDSRSAADSSSLSALLRPSPSLFYSLPDLTTSSYSSLPQIQQNAPTCPSNQFQPSSSQLPVPTQTITTTTTTASASAPPRSSRKRSRASRRAPTTVLTTDTSNFRAMVQEFTGIPSPPFAAASAATFRSRFDHLFPSPGSSLRSVTAGGVDPNSLPPYLLRPFAQKIRPFGFSSSSPSPNIVVAPTSANAGSTAFSLPATITTSNTAAAAATGNISAPTANHNYQQLPSSSYLGVGAGVGSYLSTIQDQGYVSFQNLLNSQLNPPPLKYDAGNMLEFGARPSTSSTEFLSAGIGLTTHGLIGSDTWRLHHRGHGHGSDELSGLIGAARGAPTGSATDRGSGCKLNYSTAATTAADFNIDDRQESGTAAATTTRGEGMVDSWIFSSDDS